jgi:hypothetical protein
MKFFALKKWSVVALLASYLFLAGCATIQDPAFSKTTKSIDTSTESIGFFTLRISNSKNKSYQPNASMAFIWQDVAGDRKKYSIKMDESYNKKDNAFNEYIVSFKLAPGNYVLREIFAQSGVFPVMGTFSVPMYKKITVPQRKVVYFGHIDANVVDRTNDSQLRAGSVIPLIDQAVVGASSGTFVIDIQDRFAADTELVKRKFSYLGSAQIENMTLSKWEKPTEADMK